MIKASSNLLRLFFLVFLASSLAQASTITGTVTNKSSGKPSSGDKVVLVNVASGMSDEATATTDANGHFTLNPPGVGPYIVRAEHQGGSYFIAAPKEGAAGAINVYDVAEKVEGVSLDADLLLIEAKGKVLRCQEQFLIRNSSNPPRAQFSAKTFEFVLPEGAELDGVSAARPGGMATNVRAMPLKPKGHYAINVPIQPSLGEKETTFKIEFHLPYTGKLTYKMQPTLAADAVEIYVAKGIEFAAAQGASFQSGQLDASILAYVAKNVAAGQPISFTVSGEGQVPRDTAVDKAPSAASATGAGSAMGADSGAASTPGGGMGVPNSSPDPLSKYKGWILAGLVLLMAAAAAFFLRKQGAVAGAPVQEPGVGSLPPAGLVAKPTPAADTGALIATLKDELFALESARLSGTIEASEYAEAKAALETLMRRALKR